MYIPCSISYISLSFWCLMDNGWTVEVRRNEWETRDGHLFLELLDWPFHEARNERGCPSCNIINFPIGSMDSDTGKLQYHFFFPRCTLFKHHQVCHPSGRFKLGGLYYNVPFGIRLWVVAPYRNPYFLSQALWLYHRFPSHQSSHHVEAQMHKNCPLDAVIKVLEEERCLGRFSTIASRNSENEIEMFIPILSVLDCWNANAKGISVFFSDLLDLSIKIQVSWKKSWVVWMK